jgi:hypothetical protein
VRHRAVSAEGRGRGDEGSVAALQVVGCGTLFGRGAGLGSKSAAPRLAARLWCRACCASLMASGTCSLADSSLQRCIAGCALGSG